MSISWQREYIIKHKEIWTEDKLLNGCYGSRNHKYK